MLFYSLPVYLFGFAILLLFEPTLGALPLPFFFHPLDDEALLQAGMLEMPRAGRGRHHD